MKPTTITGSINARILELLEENPNGLRWVDLAKNLKETNSAWHPKTINGCIWQLVQKFPDQVYKPEKGLFRLVKFRSAWAERQELIN